jgi:hypothetical protein
VTSNSIEYRDKKNSEGAVQPVTDTDVKKRQGDQAIPPQRIGRSSNPLHLSDNPSDNHFFWVPRIAEQAIATSPIIAATKKVKFIALTKAAGSAGVGVADGSPL